MSSQKTILDYFIDYLSNTQPSGVLPTIGVGAGVLSSLIRRGSIPPESKNSDLINSILLGGLAGTGAEMARFGGANTYDTLSTANRLRGKHPVLKKQV